MVQITVKELGHKIERAHKGQNTPLLNGLCEDLALPALAKDTKERVKDLRTHIYNVVNEENYLTSLAVSQDDPGWIAMGSAQRKKDGKFYLYFILDVTAAQMVNETGPRFKLLRIEKLDIPIYSLDWSGPHLLVGSNHGLVRLYTLRQKEDKRPFVLAAEYKAPADQMAYMDGPLYVQGEYPMNSRIQRVQFAYNYSADYVYRRWQPLGDIPVPDRRDTPDVCSQFLSVFCNRVNIWDAVAEDAPSSSIKVHPSRLNCASWSPHAPCTLIVAGGCAKTLHIIDTRANRTVWTASEAHSRPIRDAKFSTFIPYWLASGGEDGVVNIFDIRATNHAAVAKISGHEGVIESISWSNMRPENLATTSADGTFRMWMLCKDAVPVSDTFYRARKWTKDDTPPAFLRPDERYIRQNWCGNAKDLIVPWAEAHPNYYYDDYDDPWGRSLDLEPQTMLLMGAIGVGGWGRTDKGPVYIGEDVEKSKGPVVEALCTEYPSRGQRHHQISIHIRQGPRPDCA
ncbi:WD40-repeat-containing domain protein [Dichotomocladium elegans]|nr:WD40-repeat-containing domain protein [Dichotomocladium elegans]